MSLLTNTFSMSHVRLVNLITHPAWLLKIIEWWKSWEFYEIVVRLNNQLISVMTQLSLNINMVDKAFSCFSSCGFGILGLNPSVCSLWVVMNLNFHSCTRPYWLHLQSLTTERFLSAVHKSLPEKSDVLSKHLIDK